MTKYTTNGSTGANGSTGTVGGVHGGATVIGAVDKTGGATGNTVADNTVAGVPESVQAVERAAQLASTGSDVTALAVAGVMAMLMGAGVMVAAKRRN
ncbi:LPXTG cell wall anchor domain-containing protein [Bifidobacterium pseudolongum]|uniref:Cell surface protein n=1 Tax=Bifidobacterium pseudolongum subsp. globosum TaxID=1690 RepID=A0A4Q5A7H8_9BIFI|nr:LPXTG cell wall anchor domain-containing protein [Bifidobacterium pseudolongum]RYQ19490.1 cell surface protein [Bifidobacterium pseudolongum subsp. globosum]